MFHVGLENNTEGRSQAWVLGYPGCYGYGIDSSSALDAVPHAIREYRRWIAIHTSEPWLAGNDVASTLDETWECYTIDDNYDLAQEGYEVNAWFRQDWKSLTAEDIRRGLLLLEWGRLDLLKIIDNLSPEILEQTYPGERWSIAGILNHIGSAEWWYLDRLGLAFPRYDLPEKPLERLDRVRSLLVEVLPGLAGSNQVIGVSGEFWSPTKLLRRTVWHESDHIGHIRKLL